MTEILDLIGATCTSCALGIEHMGRRLAGVEEIHVDRGAGTIHIDYDGTSDTIGKIQDFVRAIGYEARLREVE